MHVYMWMKAWNIIMSSEKRQRSVMKNDIELVQITAQSVPFSFTIRQGSQEICPAPLACVDHLAGVIFQMLDENNG